MQMCTAIVKVLGMEYLPTRVKERLEFRNNRVENRGYLDADRVDLSFARCEPERVENLPFFC